MNHIKSNGGKVEAQAPLRPTHIKHHKEKPEFELLQLPPNDHNSRLCLLALHCTLERENLCKNSSILSPFSLLGFWLSLSLSVWLDGGNGGKIRLHCRHVSVQKWTSIGRLVCVLDHQGWSITPPRTSTEMRFS